jgi:hypothetical protein
MDRTPRQRSRPVKHFSKNGATGSTYTSGVLSGASYVHRHPRYAVFGFDAPHRATHSPAPFS